jgi:hypothetical protein
MIGLVDEYVTNGLDKKKPSKYIILMARNA